MNTRRKIGVLFMGVLLSNFMYCQIGINTKNPKAHFHIDAAGNTTTTLTIIEQLDDFVINSEGQVGIGTISPSPFSAVEIASRKPILLPRLSAVQISALEAGIVDSDPKKNGLIIYNSGTNCLNYWTEDGKKTLCQ